MLVQNVDVSESLDEMVFAGEIVGDPLDQPAPDPPAGRVRHKYGDGPFAVLKMPSLPDSPGLYVWCVDGTPVYVGQTRTSLRKRLGSNGYARISPYNTLARQPGRTNGGQQTNCRVNALANEVLRNGHRITLEFRVTDAEMAIDTEAKWMRHHGLPRWNLQDRR